jgi:signal transduction histidine kinase
MVEERNRFYRHVSHEVRTPLTSIIGFTELITDDESEPLTPGQKVIMQKVTSSAHRLLNMINNLLDISRVEAGRMEVRYNDVRLDELIEQVVDHMMPLVSEKGLEIATSFAGDTPLIVTDEQKLVQILTNLISNAVKYTPEGTIKINAAVANEQAIISVVDTGVGIPEDELDNIFNEFHRVQVGPIQRGSGLGLTIVKKLTDLLEGSVIVQSRLHEGSTFTLTLPNASHNTTDAVN